MDLNKIYQLVFTLNAERKLVNDILTLNDERTRNANEAQTRAQCERWTNDERYIRKVLALFLTPLVRIYMYMYIWVIQLCNVVFL